MDGQHDLGLILKSRTPIIVAETREERRVLDLLRSITLSMSSSEYLPLFRWTVTDGLQRLDIDLAPQALNSDPTEVLKHIRAVTKPGIYVLLDFHPFLQDPVNVRLLKDICLRYETIPRQIVLLSYEVTIPAELESYTAHFDLAMPTEVEREQLVAQAVEQWTAEHQGRRPDIDAKARQLLISNLAGMTFSDTDRLARNVLNDGAIAQSDLPAVMQAKYELLNRQGTLRFEYDTVRFADVGGFARLKEWLAQRKDALANTANTGQMDSPRGMLLTGVQGCGKSLAAKATAGIFGVPLLRFDFGSIYDKYHGETERKLRESLQTAEVMSPCVFWIDEIEKGTAGRGGETGTTQRVLATFLTWMAEKSSPVFVVATANDINALPPELIRKGRFDEIFFVDLPNTKARICIFAIHLTHRKLSIQGFDLKQLAAATNGFSGAEIEQAIVSALYTAHALKEPLNTTHVINEIERTRPLSRVMRERVDALRKWASGRTVPCD